MPHSSEEPQIHPSVPGPRKPAAPALTPQTSRTAFAGPRPGPHPAPPRADRSLPGPAGSGQTGPASAPSATAAVPGQSTSTPKTSAKSAPTAQIQLVNTTDSAAVDTADETVDKLLDNGRAPADVLVLTTGEQHPWAQHELSFGEASYWQQLADGSDVFAAHATAAQHVQSRPVVVLAVNGGADDVIAGALPSALGRATEELIVCGDPQRLRTLL